MRLLQCSNTDGFTLTEAFGADETIPPYAILSHTWGADTAEVNFNDLINGVGQDKPGYEKIRFCGDQAKQDGLQYFWIDTCCINKANKAEFAQAINSMFRWYCNAARCYVYLQDVSTADQQVHDCPPAWVPAFRNSRWFTRGWTLQELLAPDSVEFFSRQRTRLSDKSSLEEIIHEATAIPKAVLQGALLSQFSINDRLSWIEPRETKLEEDKAYSLLGIFGVYIAPIYGEGIRGAFRRLLDEISKLEKCTQDLHLTDPRSDKSRIEGTKGGLLEGSYHWILANSDFRRWRSDDQQSHLLWVKGDPGKGKTMLLCGIINELEKTRTKTDLLAYFFCQATDSRINTATAVLRGLLYMLVDQKPSLIAHIRKKHDHTGKALFEDANSWVALSEIFIDILQDICVISTYLVIDALDECVAGLPELLDFIVKTTSLPTVRVKWIVSSRNWPNIEERLERAGEKINLSLELNAASVSTAVHFYIQHRVAQLALEKKYDDNTRSAVLDHLSLHANDTFLWVALVCQNLGGVPKRNVIKRLSAFPPGLDSLYGRMMQQISSSDDASLCRRILASIAVVYRPITLEELTSLVEELEDMEDDMEQLQEIIGLCGSLLTIRDSTIYFVHQSAKDFLFKEASNIIFPSGSKDAHKDVFSRSLLAMSNTLRRDIYDLRRPGYPIEQVKQPNPDPLVASRYSCIYWIDHLCDWNPSFLTNNTANHNVLLQDGGAVDNFLGQKYLYWLEALSLCKSMSKGVVSMAKLEAITNGITASVSLKRITQDARRFIMYHKWAIENCPLQVYASALIFSPSDSLVSVSFQNDKLKGIKINKPTREDRWSSCLQTLEGHSGSVTLVAFSHDSARLASASDDGTVKIWDANSGECLLTLTGHTGFVNSASFSHNSTRLATASYDSTIKVWDASSGECLSTLKGHSSYVNSVAFSHDSTRLASSSVDTTVKIWKYSSMECLLTLKGHGDIIISVAFSHDSTRLASASFDKTVKLWDMSSGNCLLTLEGHGSIVNSVVFFHDSTRLASGSYDKMVKIWDSSNGECLMTFNGHSDSVMSVALSHDSTRLASASRDRTIKIWDASNGECQSTLEGHSGTVYSVAFSHDSTRLVSGSHDEMVKIWDATTAEYSSNQHAPMIEGHNDSVSTVVFSQDSTRLASGSYDNTVKIWDASSGKRLLTLEGHFGVVNSVAFSHDSTRLVSASEDGTVRIWDVSSGRCLSIIHGHSGIIYSVTFSHDSMLLGAGSYENTVKIWDTNTSECLSTLKGHDNIVKAVAFSHDSTRLASGSYDNTVKIWDTGSRTCLLTLNGHGQHNSIHSVAFSYGLSWIALASHDGIVKICDTSSGECLQTLKVGRKLDRISFNTSNTCLQTDIGVIDIGTLSGSNAIPNRLEPQSPQYQGLALSEDGVWITYNSENMVRLPTEYRSHCSAVSGNIIGLGVGSGRVWICELQHGSF